MIGSFEKAIRRGFIEYLDHIHYLQKENTLKAGDENRGLTKMGNSVKSWMPIFFTSMSSNLTYLYFNFNGGNRTPVPTVVCIGVST